MSEDPSSLVVMPIPGRQMETELYQTLLCDQGKFRNLIIEKANSILKQPDEDLLNLINQGIVDVGLLLTDQFK